MHWYVACVERQISSNVTILSLPVVIFFAPLTYTVPPPHHTKMFLHVSTNKLVPDLKKNQILFNDLFTIFLAFGSWEWEWL